MVNAWDCILTAARREVRKPQLKKICVWYAGTRGDAGRAVGALAVQFVY